eukprot:4218005-Amphidinium_carterae.1
MKANLYYRCCRSPLKIGPESQLWTFEKTLAQTLQSKFYASSVQSSYMISTAPTRGSGVSATASSAVRTAPET